MTYILSAYHVTWSYRLISFWWECHTVSLLHTRPRLARWHHIRETLRRVCLYTLLSPQLSLSLFLSQVKVFSFLHWCFKLLSFTYVVYIIGVLSHLPRAKRNEMMCNTRNTDFTRWGEDQVCTSLVKGLPYISRRTGDQSSLEKYGHGRDSTEAVRWHTNLSVLRFALLFQDHPLWGSPVTYGQFETGEAVPTISRGRWEIQVVKELKERDTHVKKQVREVDKRSLESGHRCIM